MREVIRKVIETEAEAKRIVEAAKTESGRISSDAQKQGQALRERTRQEARLAAAKMLEVAAQEAEREKQERLARATTEIETQVGLDEAMKQRAVEGVVRCVCGFG